MTIFNNIVDNKIIGIGLLFIIIGLFFHITKNDKNYKKNELICDESEDFYTFTL